MKTFALFCTLLLSSLALDSELHASYPCAPQTLTISSVPYNIPNDAAHNNTTYCVTANLSLGVPGPAITIQPGVHDIIIDFNGFDLTLPTNQTGIQLLGTQTAPVSNVLIKNGTIQASAETTSFNSNGIVLTPINATAVITALSNNQNLPTLNPIIVDTTDGFNPLGGTITISTTTGPQTLSYASTTPTSFVGVTGGTGTLFTGGFIFDSPKSFDRVIVENMRLLKTKRGIWIPNPNDLCFNLTVRQCEFNHQAVGSTNGIACITIQGIVVEDCRFLLNSAGTGVGMNFVNNAFNGMIQRCQFNGGLVGIAAESFDDPLDGLILFFPTANFLIDQCEFENLVESDITIASCQNFEITNSNFHSNSNADPNREAISFSTEGTASPGHTIFATGLLIDHCNFYTGTTNSNGQFGTRAVRIGVNTVTTAQFPSSVTKDVIIRNSTFTHLNAPKNYRDLIASFVDGLMVEDCVFNSNPSGRNPDCSAIVNGNTGLTEKAANIQLGYAGFGTAKNVTIRRNQIGGGAQVGILSEAATNMIVNLPNCARCPYQTIFGPNQNIVIANNNITAAEQGILLNNTIDSYIKGNYISGVNGSKSGALICAPGVGIQLSGPVTNFPTASSSCNIILGNTVVNNGTGILVESGAHGNLIKRNRVFNNSSKQIVIKDKAKNVKENNTTFSIGTPCTASPADF